MCFEARLRSNGGGPSLAMVALVNFGGVAGGRGNSLAAAGGVTTGGVVVVAMPVKN